MELLNIKIGDLDNQMKILGDDVDDTRNQSLRKTLIFRNIQQELLKESWNTTKRILTNEIRRIIPNRSLEEILTKIERPVRPKPKEN